MGFSVTVVPGAYRVFDGVDDNRPLVRMIFWGHSIDEEIPKTASSGCYNYSICRCYCCLCVSGLFRL